jgi:hypothetical protein
MGVLGKVREYILYMPCAHSTQVYTIVAHEIEVLNDSLLNDLGFVEASDKSDGCSVLSREMMEMKLD